MKIQVEIPVEKLDIAVKNLKKELDKALAKIKQLEIQRDNARNDYNSVIKMKADFESLCNQYADLQ